MAFYFSKRKLRGREVAEAGELNIVPYLDILMNLIIFMLLSMTGLAAFGILNVNAPNYGGPSAAANPENPDKPQQVLSVLISKKGFFVAGAGAVLGNQSVPAGVAAADGSPTLPKKGDAFDFEGLTRTMADIKTHPDFRAETKVIIGAESDVPYEILIQTMDAVREVRGPSGQRQLLFPDVTLAVM